MPKIKINDLPKNAMISEKAMKQIFGGSLMTMPVFRPSSTLPDDGRNRITIRGYDKMHRLTRGTSSELPRTTDGTCFIGVEKSNFSA